MSTDADKKLRAQKLLIELLGESQGLPTKIGQFLSMKEEADELQEALNASVNPMPWEEVVEILNREYGGDFHTVFRNIKPQARPASLGQVHPGTLKNGQPVAIKIQYLGIKEKVDSELKILGWLPGMGPMKKWGMDLAGYIRELREHLDQELDYTREADQQVRYREKWGDRSDVIVPKVYPEYSNEKVLVQAFEKGQTLEKVIGLPQEKRQEIGKIWVSHILFMLFHKGIMHSDPNPLNFAFRTKGRSPGIVLYDFGSLFEVTQSERMLLLRIILAIRNRENIDPAQCLKGLGFDLEKLNDIRHCLPGLLAVLFEPFIQDEPFDFDDWNINKRWDDIVGDLKWWFRSAAPPRVIFLMRTFHGLVNHLGKLKVSISWSFLLDDVAGDLFEQASEWPLPEFDENEEAANFDGLSRYLKIDVRKGNGNRVELTMPARVAENLEEVIDPPVLESIKNQNIDLESVQKRIQRSGFQSQILLEMEDSVRKVKVWLE
ncbi:MAG: hypothetical protein G3M70_17285 [Candidatus Nitronauta litoralis]|uniref:ABC1 atypical kinase-like domain-containing protein n=1 Tax=Candidatus Nitronauta litoralis TaxID=2705533 RepID=A0A7T0BZQ3_9BACT|nr:MAG: hypothetical protein G3M70_17285 [Candidatus Nitronauta litoralis]